MEAGIVKGDWVARNDGTYRPTFGIVKKVWRDKFGTALDIIIYDWQGNRVGRGRESPPEGGPTTYEPACPAKYFSKINEPKFPLELDITQNYAGSLKFV